PGATAANRALGRPSAVVTSQAWPGKVCCSCTSPGAIEPYGLRVPSPGSEKRSASLSERFLNRMEVGGPLSALIFATSESGRGVRRSEKLGRLETVIRPK